KINRVSKKRMKYVLGPIPTSDGAAAVPEVCFFHITNNKKRPRGPAPGFGRLPRHAGACDMEV
ncbi:MAG: hypothetical protein WAK94_17210, partial [Steroidobacteraceae bacterium]